MISAQRSPQQRNVVVGNQNKNLDSMEQDDIKNDTAKVDENIVEKQLKRGKSYYKTTVFVTGLLFLFNFALLFFGTIYGEDRINVAKFYGFKEGKHDHLQRSVGIYCFIMFLVNMFPLLKHEEHGKNSMLLFSAICNCIVIGHYLLETLWFVGMRIEVMAIQAFVLLVNLYWSYVDFRERRNVLELQGRDPEEAHEDMSVRKKLNLLQEEQPITQKKISTA
jgi:hypothetical protein